MRTFAGSIIITACTVCAVWGAACDSDDEPRADAGPADGGGGKDSGSPDGGGGKKPLRVATYNAGLLASVGYVPERAPLTIQAIADLDVDVVCTQEIWQQQHWDALVDASAEVRPHVLRLDPKPGVEGKCTPDEFAPLRMCAEAQCADVGASDLTSCTVERCPAEVGVLSPTCVDCLLDNISSGDFDMIEAACLGQGSSMMMTAPSPDERSYFYGGSFGIGVLSRYAFSESDELELDSSGARRGILYARVDVPQLGELSVFCTHLTPDTLGSGYDGGYDGWQDENAAHVAALIDWVDEKTGGSEPVIVLGDLNTGPTGDGIEPELASNYAKLPAAGFDDPFLAGSNAACTFCKDNALVIPFDTGVDAAIDHVLVRDLDAKVSVKRIFTDEVAVETAGDAGAGAAPSKLPLSDHYGLQATIAPQ